MRSPFVQSKVKKNAPISHPQQVLNPTPAPGRLLSAPNRVVQVHPTLQHPFASPLLNLPQVGINLQSAAFGAYQQMFHLLPFQTPNAMVPLHLFSSSPNPNASAAFCCRPYAEYMHHKAKTGKKKAGRVPHAPKCPTKQRKSM